MTSYREILRLDSLGVSGRSIASALGCSRNTVADVINRAVKKGIVWPISTQISDSDLQQMLFPEKQKVGVRKMPDYEYVHRELARSGVTLNLLWNEYCFECNNTGEIPLGYTQFRYHYHQYAATTKATMHIKRKPGEIMEVDWAGQTASIVDRQTCEIIPVYVFVAVLSSSGYAYVEGFVSRNQESWISAHINTFSAFGGVAKVIVPDNLKTGVDKACWYSPIINRTYQEMAEYYGCAIIPARIKKPKDKPIVEGTVGVISTWVIASLRNQKYFDLQSLNKDIAKKLKIFNEKPFQKKPGSRLSVFLEEEKQMLLPLPKNPYELAVWKKATVQFNYHVSVDSMFYSVPHEYIKQKVDVRVTRSMIEVFYNNIRICSHPKLFGKHGQYRTIVEHMPEKHKKYAEWNSERFVSWANSIGENTATVIKSILSYHRIEQQGYRACMGILKLADKYGTDRLEMACLKALSYTSQPSYKNIDSILKSRQGKSSPPEKEKPKESATINKDYGFTRGADYYGRKD